ncbi:MAG: hypothetical protein LBD55_11065 [Treponema sp.]|nr:hypothetical protein [Treponema sp.]
MNGYIQGFAKTPAKAFKTFLRPANSIRMRIRIYRMPPGESSPPSLSTTLETKGGNHES